MTRPTIATCAACSAPIKRSTGLPLCRADAVVAHSAFEAAHRGADPTTRQRAWAVYFAGKSAPAVAAAKSARMAGVTA